MMDTYLSAKMAEQWAWWLFCNHRSDEPIPPQSICLSYLQARSDWPELQAEVMAWLPTDRTTWCMAQAMTVFFDQYQG